MCHRGALLFANRRLVEGSKRSGISASGKAGGGSIGLEGKREDSFHKEEEDK